MSLQLITTVDSARVAQNQFVAFNAPTTSVDFFGLIGIKVCDSPSVIRMEKDNPRRASWIVHFPFSDLMDFHDFRVFSPCSISFQNSRVLPSCWSSETGSLLRKRKSRNVFLCNTRWTLIPSSVLAK